MTRFILLLLAMHFLPTTPLWASMSIGIAGTSSSIACQKHDQWLARLKGFRAKTAKCQSQIDSAMKAVTQGYQICRDLNPRSAPCSACTAFSNSQNLQDLQAIQQHQDQSQNRAMASDVMSQYSGLLEGLNKDEDSCLHQLKDFREDLTCKLSPEFGEAPPKTSWWNDFWNRDQSEAPFADIPPWLKMGITTVASAYCWRGIRGGGTMPDVNNSYSGMRRMLTAACYTGLGYFNGGLDGAITGALMTPGLFVPYGEQMVMKNGVRGVDQSEKWRNLAYMSGLGLLTTAAPSAYLYARGYDPTAMIAGGGVKGLCYFGSWNWAPNAFSNSPNKEFVGGVPTQTAELCNGATIGAGMSYSLLYGKKDKSEKKKPAPIKCDDNTGVK